MDERAGQIVFINSHDYVSGGQDVVGCLAFIRADDGKETALYTKSLRLQQTLEMAYASKRKVRLSFWPEKADAAENQLKSGALFSKVKAGFDGPLHSESDLDSGVNGWACTQSDREPNGRWSRPRPCTWSSLRIPPTRRTPRCTDAAMTLLTGSDFARGRPSLFETTHPGRADGILGRDRAGLQSGIDLLEHTLAQIHRVSLHSVIPENDANLYDSIPLR